MRAAYRADSALDAPAQLNALARDLDKTHPGAAASLRVGVVKSFGPTVFMNFGPST